MYLHKNDCESWIMISYINEKLEGDNEIVWLRHIYSLVATGKYF